MKKGIYMTKIIKKIEKTNEETVAETVKKLDEIVENKPVLEQAVSASEIVSPKEESLKTDSKINSEEPKKEAIKEKVEQEFSKEKQAIKTNKLGSIGVVVANIPNKEVAPIDLNQYKQNKNLEQDIEELKQFKDNHEILWARVTGAIYDKDAQGNISRVGVKCDWKSGIQIIIPDYLYFPSEIAFDYNYSKLTPEEQIRNRHKSASFQVNALVCFTVLSISVDETDGSCRAIGNRLDALSILRDYYFFHKNFEESSDNSPKKGDETVAHVLSVRPQKVLVECMGIETYISAYNLANVPVTNCKDVVKPGDVLKVRIRKLHKDYGDPYLTLSARINARQQEIDKISIGSVYLGYVQAIKKETNIITVRLTNGVNVSVSILSIPAGIKLILNQAVVVRITKKDNTFVMGRLIEKVS